jgi:MEMO1 family protein
VVSTDLSHYLSRAQAQERDARTAAGILAKDGDMLQPKDACGYQPLRGLLQFAAGRDLTVQLLQLATSADPGGGPVRVVGYGAFLLHVAEIIATSRSHGAAAVGDAPRRE